MIKLYATRFSIVASLALLLVAPVSMIFNDPVSAVDARYFKADNIIADGYFTNSSTMSSDDIQNFLERKNSTCLKNFKSLSLHDVNNDNLGDEPYGLGSGHKVLASQVIWQAADIYNVNPQVILVTLQKEQGLITRQDCPQWRYNTALGYGCPDHSPCDDAAYGFTRQIDYGAYHFRGYYDDSLDYVPFSPGYNRHILWHPSGGDYLNNDGSNDSRAGCGYSEVDIKNWSTSSLYSYTPYRPNKSALDAGYGTGGTCSSYGNRNFFIYFTDWFGKITNQDLMTYELRITSPISIVPTTGGNSIVSFKVKNFGSSQISFDRTVVQCRNYQNYNCDSNYGGAWYLDPGQERTFSYTFNISEANTYTIIPYISMNGFWYKYNTAAGIKNAITIQKPDIEITSPIKLSPEYLAPRSDSKVSFKLQNNGHSPIYISRTVVQCRYEGQNCDSNYGGPITVKVGEAKTFSYHFTSMGGGNHRLIPYFMVDGTWYTYEPTGSGQSTRIVNVADLELRSQGVTISNDSPISGEAVTVGFTATNKGTSSIQSSRLIIQCRLNNSTNCDPDYQYNDVINPGEQKRYTASFRLSKAGSYRFTPYFEYSNHWNTYNQGQATNIKRVINVAEYYADMRLVGDIQLSPVNPLPGDDLTVSYSVKNYGSKPAYYQRSILQCRLNSSINCDPSYNTPLIVIQPNETKSFTSTLPGIAAGSYRFIPYFEQNNDWRMYDKGVASSNKKEMFVNPLTITTPITVSPSTPSTNSTATISYNVKNFSSKTVSPTSSVLQCRVDSKNCDSSTTLDISFAPGQEKTFTRSIHIGEIGSYQLVPYYLLNGHWYTYGHTSSVDTNKTLVIN